ncbi:XRE family transcriptional regulator [Rhodocyclus tenuis]|uniref:Transcriptional regulator with XRE-family HTH domain n=1 Tax=Rhodocyclus tenuis TaxID=1066 RepID=A0A840GIS3_RHOTE|nr:XRE family transcriptional regulator [Rhodocyclus tenuis]MBB4248362.1 transcriptional regulator with XRE-family HTH domain [Rhodocyclus tenuis]
MSIGDRLKGERGRLGLNQADFSAVAGTTKKSQIGYEKDVVAPDAAYLAAIAAAGADIRFIVTGQRSGDGIGQAAVHQAVLDAVDLLSLDKKVDAQQLARAVVKLCPRAEPLPSPLTSGQTIIHGDVGQQMRDNSGEITVNMGRKK